MAAASAQQKAANLSQDDVASLAIGPPGGYNLAEVRQAQRAVAGYKLPECGVPEDQQVNLYLGMKGLLRGKERMSKKAFESCLSKSSCSTSVLRRYWMVPAETVEKLKVDGLLPQECLLQVVFLACLIHDEGPHQIASKCT